MSNNINENKKPEISVVMTVYNGGKYLKDTIDSVLNQTFSDFEFIIVDDGSTDDTVEQIKSYNDKRIRLLINEKNSGVSYSANKGIAQVRGKYIARIDADDLCYPERLKIQYEYMEKNRDLIACATLRDDLIDGKIKLHTQDDANSYEAIKFGIVFDNFCFTHSTMMYRTSDYKKYELYYPEYKVAHDYALELKMILKGKIEIIPQKLIAYRIYSESLSSKNKEVCSNEDIEIRKEFLEAMNLSDTSLKLIKQLLNGNIDRNLVTNISNTLNEVLRWSGANIKLDDVKKLYTKIYIRFYMRLKKYDFSVLKSFISNENIGIRQVFSKNGFKILVACILHYKK